MNQSVDQLDEEHAGLERITVPDEAKKLRLDKFLADGLEALSRARLKDLILQGQVSLDGQTITDPSHRVKPGQLATVEIPPPEPADPLPQDIPLTIVYEDPDLIVIDKPAGMVVHPAPGAPDGTLVNALLHHCGDQLSGIGGVKRPGIVHRIDKDTSGLLVVAKSDSAHQGLAAQFAAHDLERAYFAFVWGCPKPLSGDIQGNIGRDPRDRKRMTIVKSGGKHALTHYQVINSYKSKASLIECRLDTGRTHQIRVHFSVNGYPLIGDPVYSKWTKERLTLLGGGDTNAKNPPLNRQALHAHTLGFIHPTSGKTLSFKSELPRELLDLRHSLEEL